MIRINKRLQILLKNRISYQNILLHYNEERDYMKNMMLQFPHLQKLKIENSSLSDTSLMMNSKFNLHGISILNCPLITEVGISFLSAYNNINELHIRSIVNISAESLQAISSLPLKCLDLKYIIPIGSALSALSSFKSLTNLTLEPNGKIDVNVLSIISNMLSLTYLSLGDLNVKSTELFCLSQLQNLCELHIEDCNAIDDNSILYIAKLDKLELLNLQGCMNLCNIHCLSNLDRLKSFWTSTNNKINANSISFSSNLTDLNLLRCYSLDDNTILLLSLMCPNLTDLTLHHCELITTHSILSLSSIPLIRLDICACKSIVDFSPLINMRNLTDLEIANNISVTDNIISTLSSLKLKRLDISGCTSLSSIGISHLKQYDHLEIVLARNLKKLSDISLSYFSSLKDLKELYIQGCNVTMNGKTCLSNILDKLIIYG